MAEAGYSGTPLPKKLGLKDGQAVGFFGLPDALAFLGDAADFQAVTHLGAESLTASKARFDVLHVFTSSRALLEDNAQAMERAIKRDGMVWVSWPKKASRVPTDITEDVLREVFLPIGLVDVKVCAVNDIWSGLKFMIRKELR